MSGIAAQRAGLPVLIFLGLLPQFRSGNKQLEVNSPIADKPLDNGMWPAKAPQPGTKLGPYEIQSALGADSSPNVLAVHDFGTQNDVPYIVSELLEGRTVREYGASALPLMG